MKTPISRREALRVCAAAAYSTAFLRLRAYAQSTPTPTPPPQFDVSTVKPTSSATQSTSGIATRTGVVDARNVTLQRCIIGAYSVGPHQVVGGPDWVYTDRWDILAKSDPPIASDEVLNQMLQRLLADRFQLTLHREKKILPAYVLEVDKKGPKLEKADPGESITNTSTSRAGRITMDIQCTDMDAFAQILAREMDLPVVNQTGLTGVFTFKLHWTPDTVAAAQQTDTDVSIYAALAEQLGLHLRSAKAPAEVLVIDRAEMPSAN